MCAFFYFRARKLSGLAGLKGQWPAQIIFPAVDKGESLTSNACSRTCGTTRLCGVLRRENQKFSALFVMRAALVRALLNLFILFSDFSFSYN